MKIWCLRTHTSERATSPSAFKIFITTHPVRRRRTCTCDPTCLSACRPRARPRQYTPQPHSTYICMYIWFTRYGCVCFYFPFPLYVYTKTVYGEKWRITIILYCQCTRALQVILFIFTHQSPQQPHYYQRCYWFITIKNTRIIDIFDVILFWSSVANCSETINVVVPPKSPNGPVTFS